MPLFMCNDLHNVQITRHGLVALFFTKSFFHEPLAVVKNWVVVMGTNVLGCYRHLVAVLLGETGISPSDQGFPPAASPLS